LVRRRGLELVHQALSAAVLLTRRGGVSHALVRARPVAARARAGHAVPDRSPLAEPRFRRAGLRPPRGLARPRPAGRRPAGRDRRGQARRRARSTGTLELTAEAAPAAASSRRRRRLAGGAR